MASGHCVRQRPDGHTFFCIFKWLYLPYFWVYLFPKFGVNRLKSKEDTVIWKCKKMMLRLWRFDMRMASWGLSARLKDVLCCLRRINWMLSEEWKLCAVVVKWSCVVWTVKCRVAMGVTCFFTLSDTELRWKAMPLEVRLLFGWHIWLLRVWDSSTALLKTSI